LKSPITDSARALDPKYRDLRPQLREVLRALDEHYGGRLLGIEEY
jgi:hypothetical protein